MTFPDCSSSPPGSRWWGEEHMSGQLPSHHHYPAASQRCAHIWPRVLLWPWVKSLVYRDTKIKLSLILQLSKSDEASQSLYALGRSRRTASLSIKKLGMETSVLMVNRTWPILVQVLKVLKSLILAYTQLPGKQTGDTTGKVVDITHQKLLCVCTITTIVNPQCQ